jgi:hypothetical protein
MNTRFASWLAGHAGFDGLRGLGVAAAGASPEFRIWDKETPVAELAGVWRQAVDVTEVLRAGTLPSQKLRWMFDRVIVYFERRRDGAMLLLITTEEPWVGGGDPVAALLTSFRAVT